MLKIKFFKNHLNQFKKLGINVIYLFGSRVQKSISPLSDIDIGVVFERPQIYKDKTLDIYFKLYDIFKEVLPKNYLRQRFKMREHEFDIVFLQFAPISFQFNAIKNGRVLYEKNKEKRLNYEEYIIKRHCDLQYFYNLSHKYLLERI
jgi:predicted nucleotidyltransferase